MDNALTDKQALALELPEFMQGDTEVTWLVDKLIPEQSLTVLAAKPKCGKSILSLNLALSLRLGLPFIGREVKQTKTLIIQLEDPPVLLRNRLSNMYENIDTLDGIYVRAGLPMSPEDWEESLKFITDNQIGLCIIDPLIFAIRGNEQDATAMSTVLRQLRETIQLTGCSVLLVHHHRKGGGDHGDAIRGSSAILGAVDIALELFREDEESLTATLKTTSRFEAVPDEVLTLDVNKLIWQSQGSAGDYKSNKKQDSILRALEDGEQTIEDIEESLDLAAPNFRKELKELVRLDFINERKDPSFSRGRPRYFYSLKHPHLTINQAVV